MKNFQLSKVDEIKAFDIRESFAMDNLFEYWLDSEIDPLSIELVIGETRNGANFTVKLFDLDNAQASVILTGEYNGLKKMKDELKKLFRDLNKKTEQELITITKKKNLE